MDRAKQDRLEHTRSLIRERMQELQRMIDNAAEASAANILMAQLEDLQDKHWQLTSKLLGDMQ